MLKLLVPHLDCTLVVAQTSSFVGWKCEQKNRRVFIDGVETEFRVQSQKKNFHSTGRILAMVKAAILPRQYWASANECSGSCNNFLWTSVHASRFRGSDVHCDAWNCSFERRGNGFVRQTFCKCFFLSHLDFLREWCQYSKQFIFQAIFRGLFKSEKVEHHILGHKDCCNTCKLTSRFLELFWTSVCTAWLSDSCLSEC